MKGREGRRGGGQRGTEGKERERERWGQKAVETRMSFAFITPDWILPKNIFMA